MIWAISVVPIELYEARLLPAVNGLVACLGSEKLLWGPVAGSM